jgi:3,4-dihydroxy 2-butanone 4-phosphate synthase/GTP cyclohydrolase II
MKIKASIEAILEDYKQGKMIILMDDEDRENEGDLIIMIFLVFFILISSVGL